MTKNQLIPQLATAMTNVEDDVALPTRRRAYSFHAAVADLEPGECTSRASRIDPEMSVGDLVDYLPALKERLRSTCNGAVRAAKARTGGEYSVEIGEIIAPGRSIFVVAIITRTV